MKKSYYDKETGVYIDTTTGNKYIPSCKCELCGSRYNLTVHHKLEQQKALRDLKAKKVIYPNTWTSDFIKENQRLFTLCLNCHTDIHNLSDERFFSKYGIEKDKFIYK